MQVRMVALAIGVTVVLARTAAHISPALSDKDTHAHSVERGIDRREILQSYSSARAAHFRHDATAFLADHDANWYLVADGTVALRVREVDKATTQQYFDSVKFSEITDLDSPHVEISNDGTMAWLMGHVRVRGVQRGAQGKEAPLAFDAAWIDVWQKKDGRWQIVAHANTQKDNAPPQ
jgi:ketosteroid isomerase-like protein